MFQHLPHSASHVQGRRHPAKGHVLLSVSTITMQAILRVIATLLVIFHLANQLLPLFF